MTLDQEEKKNKKLKADLQSLNQRAQQLNESVRSLEIQIENERNAQREFNLAERTERIQQNYSVLRQAITA